MEVEVSGCLKAIIPQTKMCCDFLKDIFHKEYHRQKIGQAKKEVCSVTKTIEGRRQCFVAQNVKQPYVLKNVSMHFTPS